MWPICQSFVAFPSARRSRIAKGHCSLYHTIMAKVQKKRTRRIIDHESSKASLPSPKGVPQPAEKGSSRLRHDFHHTDPGAQHRKHSGSVSLETSIGTVSHRPKLCDNKAPFPANRYPDSICQWLTAIPDVPISPASLQYAMNSKVRDDLNAFQSPSSLSLSSFSTPTASGCPLSSYSRVRAQMNDAYYRRLDLLPNKAPLRSPLKPLPSHIAALPRPALSTTLAKHGHAGRRTCIAVDERFRNRHRRLFQC